MNAAVAVLLLSLYGAQYTTIVGERAESQTHATIKSACKFINTNEKLNENA